MTLDELAACPPPAHPSPPVQLDDGAMDIPAFGLGGWIFGDTYWNQPEHKDMVRTIHAALRNGVRHFDTASIYGNGRSEQLLGQQLRKIRNQVCIATKLMPAPLPVFRRRLKLSFQRLMTDYIDILYLHWPKLEVDYAPIIEHLESERKQGRIRAIGLSNFPPEEVKRCLSSGRIDVAQDGYNLLWRIPERDTAFYREHKIRRFAYSPLAQGILTDEAVGAFETAAGTGVGGAGAAGAAGTGGAAGADTGGAAGAAAADADGTRAADAAGAGVAGAGGTGGAGAGDGVAATNAGGAGAGAPETAAGTPGTAATANAGIPPRFHDGRKGLVFFREGTLDYTRQAVQDLHKTAGEFGSSLEKAALHFCIRPEGFDGLVTGARNRSQVEAVMQALTCGPPPELIRRIDEISREYHGRLPAGTNNMFGHSRRKGR
ncbi:MAG: aldo/keto reductase [Spirochaetales bacterium]|nr:aldo/keto reductase [Spirochaetales bacterium]MCF7937368.1 aldo/keto reductase [Spirochaetales bacterium]